MTPTPAEQIDYWRERFEGARAELAENQRTIAELRRVLVLCEKALASHEDPNPGEALVSARQALAALERS